MDTELRMLLWTMALGLVHLVASGNAATAQYGLSYAMGPRDEQKPVHGVGGRIHRAFRNFMESFPFFAAAILVGAVSGRHNHLTSLGAMLYFWARVAFIPLYAAGVPVVRTLVWGASMAGIVLVLWGVWA